MLRWRPSWPRRPGSSSSGSTSSSRCSVFFAPSPFRHRGQSAGAACFVTVANGAINQSLSRIFDRHRDRLRIDPARAASAFRGLLLANAHPTMELTERLTIDEIVSVLLTGIAIPPSRRST